MAAPTSTDVGMPVTDITDESLATAEAVLTSSTTGIGQDVKYVPITGGIDDR